MLNPNGYNSKQFLVAPSRRDSENHVEIRAEKRSGRTLFLNKALSVVMYAGLALSVLVTLPLPATADTVSVDNKVTVFMGGQSDSANVGFVGATFALPGSVIGKGIAISASGFVGHYQYNDSTLGLIKATFSGGELDGVYQISHKNYWDNFSLGVRNINTDFSPSNVNNRRRGNITEFAPSLNGGDVAGPWRGDYYASYGTRLDDYLARIDVTHALNAKTRLGVATSFEGDPTYSLNEVGPFAGIASGFHSEIQCSAGISKQSNRSAGGYFRASIYRTF